VTLGLKEGREPRASLVLMGFSGPRAALETQGPQALSEYQERRAPQACLALLVSLEQQGTQATLGPLVSQALPDQMVRVVPQEELDFGDQLEDLELRDSPEHREIEEQMVSQDLLEPLDLMDLMEHQARLACLGP